MKTTKQLIEEYAKKFSNTMRYEFEAENMLWEFCKKQEEIIRREHLDQFCSTINSRGFKDWVLGIKKLN